MQKIVKTCDAYGVHCGHLAVIPCFAKQVYSYRLRKDSKTRGIFRELQTPDTRLHNPYLCTKSNDVLKGQ
jgi:hypothetical protein